MNTPPLGATRPRHPRSRRPLLLTGLVLLILGLLPLVLAGCGTPAQATSSQQTTAPQHVYRSLDIVPNKPGGPDDWPAYAPNALTVPANSLVTITIHDYDFGAAALPATSAYNQVQGVEGNSVTADGQSYSSLDPSNVAHTFTIPELHLNVPLIASAPSGAEYSTVTFTFRVGAAGTYTWHCFAPCGTDPEGWGGPMTTKGFMQGTLTVQG